MGYDPVAKDEMADTVCAEVKKLGSLTAITEQILASQDNEMVKYMLIRPSGTLSNRDYLNDKLRYYNVILILMDDVTITDINILQLKVQQMINHSQLIKLLLISN